MTQPRCLNCNAYKNCKNSRMSLFFFFIGMVSTIAVRIVIVVQHYDPLYGKLSWYIGVGGFLVYFVYKFIVEQARTRLIKEEELLSKINESKPLNERDRRLLSAILCSLSTNRDMINYFLIFSTSAIALGLALYFDLVKP